MPSAAFGLIEKPSGSVVVSDRISDGEGVTGLTSCGTLRSTSSPDGESVWVVVGWRRGLGLKLELVAAGRPWPIGA